MLLTHLKSISKIGSFFQVGVKIKNIWNHHLHQIYYHFGIFSWTPLGFHGWSSFFTNPKKCQLTWETSQEPKETNRSNRNEIRFIGIGCQLTKKIGAMFPCIFCFAKRKVPLPCCSLRTQNGPRGFREDVLNFLFISSWFCFNILVWIHRWRHGIVGHGDWFV